MASPTATDVTSGTTTNDDRGPGAQSQRPAKIFLQDYQPSQRCFWKDSTTEQLTTLHYDKHPEQYSRPLPNNEVMVMALNEIAAHHGSGFFFYLPSKNATRKPAAEEVSPVSRRPPPARSEISNIYYMRWVWSEPGRTRFFDTGHRSRYLLCDGWLGIPEDDTPLYGIQHIFHERATIVITRSPSTVLLSTASKLYLASTLDLEGALGSRSSRSFNATTPGGDPHRRIKSIASLWRLSSGTARHALEQFARPDIEAVYHRIVAACRDSNTQASISAHELRSQLPRPDAPTSGIGLGFPIGGILSSNPPSRRGAYRKRGRGGKKQVGRELADK